MTRKRLLLGDEAVALGALHAGLSGVYAYPGTPSTEITEFIQADSLARERGVRSRWCTNEKTAMEAALGMSYAGKRALVCMKHVGMNVCSDPQKAFDALTEAGVAVALSDVFAIELNRPGQVADSIKFFSDAELSIIYMYSFLFHGKGILIFRTDNAEGAAEVIRRAELKVVAESELTDWE